MGKLVHRSAIVPAHNEASTVGAVVSILRPDVDEVVVVDSNSSDDTADQAMAAGARVVRVDLLGKHNALATGIRTAEGQELVFCDADLLAPPVGLAARLLSALTQAADVTLAKAFYRRPLGSDPDGGGRVTELCARPLLRLLLPTLSGIRQPLAGEFALRRSTIDGLVLSPGYSVDMGILIHCASLGRIVEVDLGTKHHKHRPLHDLSDAALDVARTILRAAHTLENTQ